MSWEQVLVIDNDELVEVTPISTRIRNKLLTENLCKQAGRPTKA
jgi:GTP-binding protein